MSTESMQGALGIEGHFRVTRHDVRGLYGSGPNGEVEFEDLWELDAAGKWRSRHPNRLIEDRTAKNKFTRRGLGYFMYKALEYWNGTDQSKMPVEITYPASGSALNPFLAFVLVGDDSGTPTRPGDARVLWDESDTQFDDKIATTAPQVPIYGRRGTLISNTTGIFKRVQLRYPNASPNYEEHEYTFFAQANTSPMEGGGSGGGDLGIDNFVCKSIAFAKGVACGFNEADSQVGIRAVLGLPPTQQGITDRIYIHENYTYGDGSDSGLGDAIDMTKFTGSAPIADGVHGYTTSSEVADATIGSLTAHASSAFTVRASGNLIKFGNAVTDLSGTGGFVTAHLRKTLVVADSTSNNRDFTIKRIVSTTEVEVFETVVSEATPETATATLVSRYTGAKAFDSRVENEGLVDKATYDVDAVGAVIAGEKWVSSDLPGPHSISRIFPRDEPHSVRGVRITFPAGSIRDFCPDKFTIQYLKDNHGGSGDPWPADTNDWATVSGQDYSTTSQGAFIYDNGEYGYEYHFAAATPLTCGIKLNGLQSIDPSRQVEIASLYIYTAMSTVTIATGVNDKLKASIAGGGVTYKTYTCPAVAGTTSIQTICDALNRVLYGYGLEAVRSTFGYFWLRATVAGNYSQLHLDTIAQDLYTTLGLPTAGFPVSVDGVTQPLTKLYTDALTIIYTARMAGNLPKP